MFWKKSELTSKEYEDLSAKIVKLRSDIEILKAEGEKVEERMRSFHGRLTKRIKEQNEEEEEDNEQMTPADIQRALLGFGNGKE